MAQINSVVCTDVGAVRKLLASTAHASFTINLANDLTAEQLSVFQVGTVLLDCCYSLPGNLNCCCSSMLRALHDAGADR